MKPLMRGLLEGEIAALLEQHPDGLLPLVITGLVCKEVSDQVDQLLDYQVHNGELIVGNTGILMKPKKPAAETPKPSESNERREQELKIGGSRLKQMLQFFASETASARDFGDFAVINPATASAYVSNLKSVGLLKRDGYTRSRNGARRRPMYSITEKGHEHLARMEADS